MTQQERNYFNIHAWLRREHGKATMCTGENCTKKTAKRFEWALKKGCEYKKDVSCFIQLCPSCHRKYDMTDATRLKLSEAAKKRDFSTNNPMKNPETRKKASEWMKNRIVSDTTKQKHSARLKGKNPAFILAGKGYSCSGGNNSAAKVVVCLASGNSFETVTEAAESVGLKRTTLIAMLSGQNPNKTTLKYANS